LTIFLLKEGMKDGDAIDPESLKGIRSFPVELDGKQVGALHVNQNPAHPPKSAFIKSSGAPREMTMATLGAFGRYSKVGLATFGSVIDALQVASLNQGFDLSCDQCGGHFRRRFSVQAGINQLR